MIYKTLIETDELANLLAESHPQQQPVIIDCRFDLLNPNAGETAWSMSHLPGANYAHLDRDLAAKITPITGRHPLPDPQQLVKRLQQWGITNQSQVVVYDDMSGAFAVRLWWMLRWLGHQAVAVLNGGWQKWNSEQRALESTPATNRSSHFEPSISDALWLDRQTVADGLKNERICLIDARTAERFNGEVESIDTIAGHIPGAINSPFQSNLDENGCFLPATRQRQHFRQLIGRHEPDSVVHMCGSGVTAIHNLLAMEVAGLHGSRLYVGSWSEWIRQQ